MFQNPFSHRGVLGMNARNFLYVRKFNPASAVAMADNKLRTKAFLSARSIPSAKLYGRIETRAQLEQFDFSQLPDHCVLKPNFGFGGEGIILLKGRTSKGDFLRSGKHVYSREELKSHIKDILDGRFSLGGRPDIAFFEQLMLPHEGLAQFRPVGLPDIRVIVFNLVPVMAMLRIPTPQSDGKANIHLGGLGVGIDLAKGVTTHAVQYNSVVRMLPHGVPTSGHVIPFWNEIMLISSKIQQYTGIGFVGVDFTIDQTMGPSVLEVNARPGLNVQIANLTPLRSRLERVAGVKVASPEKGVRVAQDLFGTTAKTRSEPVVETKPIVGIEDIITIVGDGTTMQEPCLIDISYERTIIDAKFAATLFEGNLLDAVEGKKKMYRAKFQLGGKKIQTLVQVSTKKMPYKITVGKRDLQGLLIDPTFKKDTAYVQQTSAKSDVRAVDKLFAQIDKETSLIKHLRPINLQEEVGRCLQDSAYNPVFSYAPLPNINDIVSRLQQQTIDDSPIGQLLVKKREELLKRIAVLKARAGSADVFSSASSALFPAPSSSLLRQAQAQFHNRIACAMPTPDKEMLTAAQVLETFETILQDYGLHDWSVKIRDNMVSAVSVGGNSIYLRDNAVFSPRRVEALIAHEIETHVFTAENGNLQPYELLRRGCSNYIETQEGLAVYSQNRIYGSNHGKYYSPARNVLALDFALRHSFAETRKYLQEKFYLNDRRAISQAVVLKRGLQDTKDAGAFTKSAVYFRGWRAIEAYLEKGGALTDLYIGKVSVEDIATIKKINGLQKPLLLPKWVRTGQKR